VYNGSTHPQDSCAIFKKNLGVMKMFNYRARNHQVSRAITEGKCPCCNVGYNLVLQVGIAAQFVFGTVNGGDQMCTPVFEKRQERTFLAAPDVEHDLSRPPVHQIGDLVLVRGVQMAPERSRQPSLNASARAPVCGNEMLGQKYQPRREKCGRTPPGPQRVMFHPATAAFRRFTISLQVKVDAATEMWTNQHAARERASAWLAALHGRIALPLFLALAVTHSMAAISAVPFRFIANRVPVLPEH
jgi:hypothetical protein